MSEIHFSLVFNRKNKLNKNGEALIQICAYHKGRRKYFSSKIYIKPNQWDLKRLKVNNNHNDYDLLNDQLENAVRKIKEVIKYKKEKGEQISLSKMEDVRDFKLYSSFYDFMKDEIEKSILKESTKKTHRRTLSVMKEFKKELGIEDVNVAFLMDFERYLDRLDFGVNTVYKYFKNIRTYVNRAIVLDLIKINDYPFKKFKLRQVDGTRDFLSPVELERLERLNFDSDLRLQKVKDIFLMSCYSGARFSDIVMFTEDNFYEENQIRWLKFKMKKSEIKSDATTQKEIKLPISKMFSSKPVKIFEKYKGTKKYLFDDFTNTEINKALKEIEIELKSRKKLTFHVARHTCATNLIYHSVPISTVQKILGHDKIETTQLYAKVLDMTIVNDLKGINFGD
ncbi:site-specific integrase [Gelidibacter mesophilus]|uniref:site-specific integrase n=1 Tax=Gelidibacter mesophilus TaxID=169050 RepID=UPI00040C06CE|nr:site-specific integrase [Gelidibacter mesophilus]